jgi:hypothetical protein
MVTRGPNIGMDPDTAYQQSLGQDWMKYKVGEAMKAAYMQGMLSGSSMTGGMSGDARRVAQPARMQMSTGDPQTGGAEDAAASFQLAVKNSQDLVRLMREQYEAQQPGWSDYGKQAAMQYGSTLLGML